jgi:hypothetical protein
MCGAVAVSDYKQPYTYEAIRKLIDAGIKTNIHQIYSKLSHIKCFNIINGNHPDYWDFDVSSLNAVIFLLFKPQGAGADLAYYIPTKNQIKRLAELIFSPKSKHKVGMDSCLVNHVLQYATPSKLQLASIDTCEAARMSAYITPDMKFIPCSFANESAHAIDITDGLQTIWNTGKSFVDFRKILKTKRNCCPIGL